MTGNTCLLISINGGTGPGLVTAVLDGLAQSGAQILDADQGQVQRHLQLSLLVQVADDGVRELEMHLRTLAQAHGWHLHLAPVPPQAQTRRLATGEQPRHVLTVLGRRIQASQLAAVAGVVDAHALDIDAMHWLSGPSQPGDDAGRACLQLVVCGQPADEPALHRELLALTADDALDLSIQADDLYRTNRRLIVFDMDSTLIQCEVMDELARHAGVGDQVAAITAAAMRGEIDFNASFRQRLATLAGLDAGILDRIAQQLPITDGADRLIGTLKRLDYRIGILSGGFTYFADHLKRRWGLDAIAANELEIADGKLTGRVVGDIVNGERKAELLRAMAAEHGLDLRQTIAVGDGANDLPMLAIAGLGVAFHAKPVVRESARHAVSTLGLDAILYLLGIHDRQADA